MEALMAPLGLRLPREARQWWGWHDGVDAADCTYARDREMGAPGFKFLPLREAVARYHKQLDAEQRAAAENDASNSAPPEGTSWRPTWLPITLTDGAVVACDCSRPDHEYAPIHSILWDEPETGEVVSAASFGEMATWWIDAFDVGAWTFDHAAGGWDYQYDRLPTARHLTRLV